MALTIYTDIPNICYTSQLQEIEIRATTNTIYLSITHQATSWISGDSHMVIFQSEYATHNDSVTIYDIGSFLEAFMAQMDGLQRFIFMFVSGSTTITHNYAVIYCKQQPLLSAADLAGSNYLTNYLTRLVYRGAPDRLPYFAGFGSVGGYTSYTLHYTVFYRTPNGAISMYETERYGRAGYGVSYLNTSPETLYLLCKDVLPQGAKIFSYTLDMTIALRVSSLPNRQSSVSSSSATHTAVLNISASPQPAPRRRRPKAASPSVPIPSRHTTLPTPVLLRSKHPFSNSPKLAVSASFSPPHTPPF